MGLSNIQWCDYTFNPWIGCRKVAPECAHCYAETLDRNRYSKTLDGGTKEQPVSHWGSGPRHRTSAQNWKGPIAWNRKAAEFVGTCPKCGTVKEMTHPPAPRECPHTGCDGLVVQYRPRVFCGSLCDWLDDENVPIEWFIDLIELIESTPNIDWLLLTKRPQNWAPRMQNPWVWVVAFRRVTEKTSQEIGGSSLRIAQNDSEGGAGAPGRAAPSAPLRPLRLTPFQRRARA